MLMAGYGSLSMALLLGSLFAGVWATDWLHGTSYTSSASLPENRDPATEVNKVCGKETKGGLKVKETRVTQIGRDDEEKKVTEYYSNGTEKVEASQGLDKRQGKKGAWKSLGAQPYKGTART